MPTPHFRPHPSSLYTLKIHSGSCLTPSDHDLAQLRLPTKPQGPPQARRGEGDACLRQRKPLPLGAWVHKCLFVCFFCTGLRGHQRLMQRCPLWSVTQRGTGLHLDANFKMSASPTPENPRIDRPPPPALPVGPSPSQQQFEATTESLLISVAEVPQGGTERQHSARSQHLICVCWVPAGPLRE